MGVYVRESKGHLFLDIYWNGKRQWLNLGLRLVKDEASNRESRRLAERIRLEKEHQLVAERFGLPDPVAGKQTLIEYAKQQAIGRSPQDHLYRLVRYLEAYGDNIQLQAVNSQWAENFKKWLLVCPMLGRTKKSKKYLKKMAETKVEPKKLSKRSASHLFKGLSQILSVAERDMLISKNPVKSLKGISVPEVILEYLTKDDLLALSHIKLDGDMGREIRRAFFFGCYTALRKGDIKSLTWGDIKKKKDIETGEDTFTIQKIQKKTGRIVSIPLNKQAWDIINPGDNIVDKNALVFPVLSSKKIDTNAILNVWALKAGVDKHIGWHTARRTLATLSIDNGADISTVSRLLGHTAVKTTGIYAQTTEKAKREAINGLPEIEI